MLTYSLSSFVIPASSIYSLELAAYQLAVQQWQEAQIIQDQEYLNGVYATYLNATQVFETEYAVWRNQSAAWDQQWTVYAQDEVDLYAATCGN